MDVARISVKGQVTIPIGVRRQLGLREGDKVIFMEKDNNIVLLNPNRLAWQELQKTFEGAAEEAGFRDEQDVVNYCKEIRREIQEERKV